MLVLSRKLGERIVIGANVEVVILKIRGNCVQIGIEAPREVPVLRGELPRRAAAESPPPNWINEERAKTDAYLEPV